MILRRNHWECGKIDANNTVTLRYLKEANATLKRAESEQAEE